MHNSAVFFRPEKCPTKSGIVDFVHSIHVPPLRKFLAAQPHSTSEMSARAATNSGQQAVMSDQDDATGVGAVTVK
jgi:hypothetical protein